MYRESWIFWPEMQLGHFHGSMEDNNQVMQVNCASSLCDWILITWLSTSRASSPQSSPRYGPGALGLGGGNLGGRALVWNVGSLCSPS